MSGWYMSRSTTNDWMSDSRSSGLCRPSLTVMFGEAVELLELLELDGEGAGAAIRPYFFFPTPTEVASLSFRTQVARSGVPSGLNIVYFVVSDSITHDKPSLSPLPSILPQTTMQRWGRLYCSSLRFGSRTEASFSSLATCAATSVPYGDSFPS